MKPEHEQAHLRNIAWELLRDPKTLGKVQNEISAALTDPQKIRDYAIMAARSMTPEALNFIHVLHECALMVAKPDRSFWHETFSTK
jgi:hypothetical protein